MIGEKSEVPEIDPKANSSQEVEHDQEFCYRYSGKFTIHIIVSDL